MYQRLDQYLDYHARVHPDVIFVTQEESSLSFSQALHRVNLMASRLADNELSRGDRIAVLGKNSIDFLLVYLACSKRGVVPVGVNYRLSAPEAEFVIRDANAKMVFVDEEFVDVLAAVCEELPAVVLYGEHRGLPSMEQWLAQASGVFTPVDVQAHDVLSQMYTSGTTGHPKGVLLSHNNVISNVYQTAMGAETTFNCGDRFLLVAPMYHAAGIMSGYTGVVQGLHLIIHRDYDPERVVQTLVSEPVTAVTLVPAMLQFIIENISGLDALSFPYLQLLYYGASPISVELLKRAIEIFDCDFTQGYGQTEANSIVAMLSPSDHRRALQGNEALLKACGRAVFNTELRIVDDTGQVQDTGQAGEIIARGPQVMLGYWNNPDATAETLREGWLHTGDIGTMDAEGYVTIVGRMKDMIISGGENIYPAEIENVLLAHPQISDVAVVGVSDKKWGEVPLAVIVSGQALDSDPLRDFCRKHLAPFKVPAHFRSMPELPRNASGKILKQQLRERYDECQ